MSFIEMLHTFLPKAKAYGEYGAGESTQIAAQMPNLAEIHSVESDRQWIEDIRRGLPAGHKVVFHHKEMGTTYKSWGHPAPTATEAQRRAYSDPIQSLNPIDVLLVDGRFRVACALKAHGWLSDSAVLIFDDFWIRPHYHIVLDYYDVIQRSGTAALLKQKVGTAVPTELIQQYELVVD
jgi:hypothetical protein